MIEALRIKQILFAHCSAAADKAICDPADQKNRHDGGKRQDEAAYTALLGVIADAGLGEEYRRYETETITTAYSEEKGG